MKRRNVWLPGWERKAGKAPAPPPPREPEPGIETWLIGPGGKAELPPAPKRTRGAPGPLPVRSGAVPA